MRILLTTDTVGGVWTFGRELATGLLEQGHAVALVSFGRAPSDAQAGWARSMRDQWGADFRFEASEAPLEWMEGNDRAFEEGAATLRQVAAEFRPEVVHASQFCWGALEFGVPVMITAHSDVLSWAQACRPEGLEDSAWLRTYVRLVSEGLAGADAVVAPTEWMATSLSDHYPVPLGVSVVSNGRSLPPPALPEATRAMQAISVGRIWDEAKGMGLLAEGGWPMPVVIAGEDRFVDGESAKIAGVTALGMLDEQSVLAAMRASAVYLCLSVYEPFGLSAVEAGLCGCAVVCRDIPSLREVWGGAALYFTDRDGLRALLLRLRDNTALLKRMQAMAESRTKRYTLDVMTAEYLQVYARMTDPTHRGEAAMNGAHSGMRG